MTARFIRAQGEAFDADQLEGICDGCDLPHSHCACDPEQAGCQCGQPVDATGWCRACQDWGVSDAKPLGGGWWGVAA